MEKTSIKKLVQRRAYLQSERDYYLYVHHDFARARTFRDEIQKINREINDYYRMAQK